MYVFVALVIQPVTRVRHIVICCLSGSAIFFHIIPTHGTIFGEKMMTLKICVLIFSRTFV
jgi:hypothetical protein